MFSFLKESSQKLNWIINPCLNRQKALIILLIIFEVSLLFSKSPYNFSDKFWNKMQISI